jgi:hypothetical protein
MDYKDINKFIAETGYRSSAEIEEHFSGENAELIETNLNFLVERHHVKRVRYTEASSGVRDLYYIPA